MEFWNSVTCQTALLLVRKYSLEVTDYIHIFFYWKKRRKKGGGTEATICFQGLKIQFLGGEFTVTLLELFLCVISIFKETKDFTRKEVFWGQEVKYDMMNVGLYHYWWIDFFQVRKGKCGHWRVGNGVIIQFTVIVSLFVSVSDHSS